LLFIALFVIVSKSMTTPQLRVFVGLWLFLLLVGGVPFAAIAFGIASVRKWPFPIFLNLIFTGIAVTVAIRFEDSLAFHWWTTALGLFSAIITVALLRSKASGYFLAAQTSAFFFLSGGILFAQGVSALRP
jgi:hypothetical protein